MNISKNTISVIIVTKDRFSKLVNCIESISKGNTKPDEIIIINQGKKMPTNYFNRFLFRKIVVINLDISNLSIGRNIGIKASKSSIVCFTDDDCIVDKKWLGKISERFQENKNIDGVFGQVAPYKPKMNKNLECVCTFINKKVKIISKPMAHYKHIGFGNNMAYRRDLFYKIGFFKEWLGLGSLGLSAEDAEFALRTLITKHKILYDPNVKVFHNKWLSEKELEKQVLLYSYGEIICYGYYMFQGKKFAASIIKNNIGYSFRKLKLVIRQFLLLKWSSKLSNDIQKIVKTIFNQIQGILLALYFSIVDPIS